MQLTQAQVNFFNTFGYLCIRQLFSPSEVAAITKGFEWSIQQRGGGNIHDGSKRTMFGGPIEHTPEMCAILDHPSILGLISGVIGEDFNYCSGDGNYYSGDTRWHPDGNWGQLFAVKVAFYLDPLTRDTGALRVIPGSQSPDHFIRRNKINVNQSEELFGVLPRDFPGNIALETEPGDIVIFNHDLYHAAYGGDQRRRMFTMNCIRRAKTEEDLATARKYLSVHSAGGGNFDTGAGMFFPTMIDTADAKRMIHLEQPIAIHDELFPQFARKRAA
ncbi:MAG: phytanoyl-CoA dioxygenase family protein [Caldilineaceae bacterium]|nr:phytanoyl-CoA dioxygenase family protein [Caldilineaceae bacterium]